MKFDDGLTKAQNVILEVLTSSAILLFLLLLGALAGVFV